MAYFRKAARVLKPGGRFVFLCRISPALVPLLFRETCRGSLFFTAKRCAAMPRPRAPAREPVQNRAVLRDGASNVAYHVVSRYLRQRPLRWEDLPEARNAYLSVGWASGASMP